MPLIVNFTRAARDSTQSNSCGSLPPKMLDTPALVLDVCVTSLFPFLFLVALTAKEAWWTLMMLISRVQNFGAGGGSWCVIISAEQNVLTGDLNELRNIGWLRYVWRVPGFRECFQRTLNAVTNWFSFSRGMMMLIIIIIHLYHQLFVSQSRSALLLLHTL